PNGATIAGNLALAYDIYGTNLTRVSSGANRTFTVGDSVAPSATGTANPDLTISANITGTNLGITKAGAGTLLLSGTNSFAGPITISAGELIASGSSALGGDSVPRVVSVAATSTLGVSGNASFSANTPLSLSGTGLAVVESDFALPGAL